MTFNDKENRDIALVRTLIDEMEPSLKDEDIQTKEIVLLMKIKLLGEDSSDWKRIVNSGIGHDVVHQHLYPVKDVLKLNKGA